LPLCRNLLLSPVQLRAAFLIVPAEHGAPVMEQAESHLRKQLLKGNILPFEETKHPLLGDQQVDQVGFNTFRVVHIIDILLPGADVPDETIVKLGHLAVVPVHFGQKAVVHTVDADGFRKALLGADQYGIVKILKPAVNEFPPLVRLVVAAGDCEHRAVGERLLCRLGVGSDNVVLPHANGNTLVGWNAADLIKDRLHSAGGFRPLVVLKNGCTGADTEHDLDLSNDPCLGQFSRAHIRSVYKELHADRETGC